MAALRFPTIRADGNPAMTTFDRIVVAILAAMLPILPIVGVILAS